MKIHRTKHEKTAEIQIPIELRRPPAQHHYQTATGCSASSTWFCETCSTILHALDELIDLVALLPEGDVVLVSGAGFALCRLGSILQIGNRLGFG